MSSRKTSAARTNPEKEAPAFSIDYDHLSRLCGKHWKWLLATLVLGILAGYSYAASQTPIYAAMSTIVVQSPSKEGNAMSTGRPDETGGDLLKTFEQLLQTKELSARVVKKEHLNENPDFTPKGLPISEDDATNMLSAMETIRIRPSTRLIDITVQNRSPQMAQLLANSLATESIQEEFDIGARSAGVYSDYLRNEVDLLKQKVAESQQALEDYQTSHKTAGTPDASDDFVDAQLKDLNQQYISAQMQVTLLQERYGENHPKLIQAEALRDELRKDLSRAQEGAGASYGASVPYRELQSVAQSDKTQYDNMVKELDEAEAAVHVEAPGISVADEAPLPYGPISPNKQKSVAIGGFVGVVCGLVFIFGLYFVDSSVRTVSQAEGAFGLPVVAAVPILTETDGKTVLPTFSDPQSFVAESFRGLRASLLLHDRERPLKTILVASAVPGEGKSFCGANLAVALAQAGLRTLLIDADLRLPTIHTYFNLPAGQLSNGFTDVLAGRANLSSAVLSSAVPNLTLLLTSTPADAPAELLSGSGLAALLEEAGKKYDRIVIDSAPLNAVSDTMLIVQRTDAILLVIRASQTPMSECKAALEKIYSSKMKPLGLILNYLAPHSLKSYSYGYSYGQKPKDKNAK